MRLAVVLTLVALAATATQSAAALDCQTTLGPLQSTVAVHDGRMNVTVTNTGRFTVIKPSWPTPLVTHRTQMRAYIQDGWQHTDLKPRWYLNQLHWVELGEGQVFSTGWLPMPWPEATHFVMDIVHGDYGRDYRRSKSTCTPDDLNEDTTSPTVTITSTAREPVTGPFSVTMTYSEPVTGFELADLIVGNGSPSELHGNDASFMATVTPAASGTVTIDIAAGAAEDSAGNLSAAADQFSITADLTQIERNRPPEAVGAIPPQTLTDGGRPSALPVAAYFSDPDDDPLTYSAASSHEGVVVAGAVRDTVWIAQPAVGSVGPGSAMIEVRAIDPGGLSAVQSFRVRVTAPFTDDPIQPGKTPIRAVHFTELRARIDALRRGVGLAPFGWTDPMLRAGVTPVRLVHLLELRSALIEAYGAAGRAIPLWVDPAPTAATTLIRAAHLTELRAAVVALE